nr:MAG TPA: hypothetical protein [Caudoviricetes sp.]
MNNQTSFTTSFLLFNYLEQAYNITAYGVCQYKNSIILNYFSFFP